MVDAKVVTLRPRAAFLDVGAGADAYFPEDFKRCSALREPKTMDFGLKPIIFKPKTMIFKLAKHDFQGEHGGF